MKNKIVFSACSFFLIVSFSCRTTPLVISENDEWVRIGRDIHVYTASAVNTVILKRSGRAVLINPGNGSHLVEAIKSYSLENGIEITDMMVTNPNREYNGNISVFRDSGIEFHSSRSLENRREIRIGELNLGIIPLYDYKFNTTRAFLLDGGILISGGMVDTEKPVRQSMTTEELSSITHIQELNPSLIIPGSGSLLTGTDIQKYFETRLNSAKYLVDRSNPIYRKINDNIYVFSGSEIVAQKFNSTILVSGNEAALFDTGIDAPIERLLKNFLEKENLTLKHIFITHDHFDHVGNLESFEASGVEVHRWQNTYDGEEISFNDHIIRTVFTSGHYGRGKHVSFEIDGDLLVSGDVLVANVNDVSILVSDPDDMKKSLEMILVSPYKLIIPGHAGIQLDKSLVERYLSQL